MLDTLFHPDLWKIIWFFNKSKRFIARNKGGGATQYCLLNNTCDKSIKKNSMKLFLLSSIFRVWWSGVYTGVFSLWRRNVTSDMNQERVNHQYDCFSQRKDVLILFTFRNARNFIILLFSFHWRIACDKKAHGIYRTSSLLRFSHIKSTQNIEIDVVAISW